jgi:iron complex transport system permease protein
MWIFGTFTNIPETNLFITFTVIAVAGFVIIFLYRNILDSLYLSDEVVKSLGINISITRGILFLTTSIMTIIAVSLCGIIGYVGLIVPHLAKILFGNKHKVLIPATIILGGIMMLISDDIARTLLSLINDYGKELPIGVVTSLFGTPFFLYFLLKQKKNL